MLSEKGNMAPFFFNSLKFRREIFWALSKAESYSTGSDAQKVDSFNFSNEKEKNADALIRVFSDFRYVMLYSIYMRRTWSLK